MGCCRRYALDICGLICIVLLTGISTTNQVILYMTNVPFMEVTFVAGFTICVLSVLLVVIHLVGIVRTRRRHTSNYADWNNDDDDSGNNTELEPPYTAYGVPQEEILK